MNPTLPHIAIAILNYNGRALLETYLPSIQAITYPNRSVWVIDNQSTDDSKAFLQANYPNIKWVQNEGNFGFARGYNEGLKNIEADYYLLINSDVQVSPGFIEPVLSAMEANKQVAFAQPKIRSIRQPEQFEYAGAAGGRMDGLGYPFCRGRLFDTVETDTGQYDDNASVFWASGACLFARAEVFHQLGGFYEYFFMHNEEIDLCWRAQLAGLNILACGGSVVWHLGGGSLHASNPIKTFYNFRNNLVMLARNMPAGRLTWLLPLRGILDSLAALQFLLKGNAGAAASVFKAHWAFMKWLGTQKNTEKKDYPVMQLPGIFSGSIAIEYFLKGRKKL